MPAVENAPEVPEVVRPQAFGGTVEDRPESTLQRLRVPVRPAEQLTRPEVDGIIPPKVVILRSRNGVIPAGQVVECEAPGDCLLVERLRGTGQRVRLAGLILTFGANDVLHSRQWQQFTQLGRVEHVARLNGLLIARHQVPARNRPHVIAIDLGANRLPSHQDLELAATAPRLKHCFEHRQTYPRFVANRADLALPRIEERIIAGGRRQGVVAPVIVADAIAQSPITGRTADVLDPRMLVWRHRLRRQLTAEPIGYFGQDHPHAEAECCQRSRTPAQTPADDRNVRLSLAHLTPFPARHSSQWLQRIDMALFA
jgi:hypothetical protein